jgi:hypothetical protein
VVLLAAAVVVVWLSLSGNRERRGVPWPVKQQAAVAAVPARQDSAGSKADTARTATHAEDIAKKTVRLPYHGHAAPVIDTGKKDDTSKSADGTAKEGPDTAAAGNKAENSSNNCAGDTLAPFVYPEPSGGLHRGPLTVTFQANKPCDVSWRFEPDTEWRSWSGERIAVERTATIAFKAIDRCGRAMTTRNEYYEITSEQTEDFCPQDMEFVKIGATQFCIDRYEWPNRKGALPLSYVSLYQAKDSCFIAGKRLCSTEEWSLACSGPYSWSYPYGQEYERYACVTHDTTVRPSGSKPECRAFFGAFDMSGNLLEWTGTPSRENRQFYNVMGGFWQSGPRSGCFDIRYSYFPQNRHNPVGFRCCKEATSPKK